MPKRISRPQDVNQAAFEMVRRSTQEPAEDFVPAKSTTSSKSAISAVMAEMGRKGGLIGGKRRLETMTAAKRRKIAKKAAEKRWSAAKKGA